MRILLTSDAVYSHFAPMVAPVAVALRQAGHEVAVATGAELAAEVTGRGLRHLVLPRMLGPREKFADPDRARRLGLTPEALAGPVTGESFGRLFAAETALSAAEDLIEVASQFAPELVIRENAELGAYLFAEKIGVPCVTLDTAAMAPALHDDVLLFINGSRTAFGLAPITSGAAMVGAALVSWLHPSFYPPEQLTPAHHHYQAPADEPETLAPEFGALPTDRPLVLAALGTHSKLLAQGPDRLPDIVEALGTLRVTAVVALGEEGLAGWDGPRPDNVMLSALVPQRALLRTADLFITHAGFGSVRETLEAATPVVAVPQRQDQPANARRLTELGFGVQLDEDEISAATIADAAEKVLGDPGYRHAIRGFRRRTSTLPTMSRLIADLVALVGRDRLRC
ncbi:glycosyltransferase [Streptomyces sp. NPDC088847]|uniref:glycosyltransferase n=1 Tax=Streptomyces sp. NPDC088847 TaxID=3365909 RepID=UPI00382AEB19